MATTENTGMTKAALTLGTIGTALSGLQALGGGNGNGNGLLGGLFGCNNNNNGNQAAVAGAMAYCDQLQAEIAELKAEKYSDKVGIEVYKAAAERDNRINTRFEDLNKEIADMRVREATLRGEINTNQAVVQGQIAQVASTANCGITALQNALAVLSNTVSGITKTVVPKDVICPEFMDRYNSWVAPTAAATTGA